jgi:hypothetical protein
MPIQSTLLVFAKPMVTCGLAEAIHCVSSLERGKSRGIENGAKPSTRSSLLNSKLPGGDCRTIVWKHSDTPVSFGVRKPCSFVEGFP